jgi:voltage-gated potassium channel
MARIQKQLEGQIVVVGFGISGSEAVNELIARGSDPRRIVVIDPSEERLEEAAALGCNIMAADATRDATLIDARIAAASALLVSAGRDDTSILVVLTARHLVPALPISVVVRAADNEVLARQAGATNVINPVRFTGHLLAGSAEGEHLADYLGDLASITGRVGLVERAVTAAEVGTALEDIATGRALRIYRGAQAIGFWEDGARTLQAGDRIVEVVPGPEGRG